MTETDPMPTGADPAPAGAHLPPVGPGPLLARLRARRGWSQSDLANQLCAAAGVATVTRHEISRWERQRRLPGPFWSDRLAAVLGVPPTLLRVRRRPPPRRDAAHDRRAAGV